MANDAADEIRFEWIDGPDNERGTRPATKAEWDAIDEICAEFGWPSLNRVLTRILIAFREEAIVGFHVFQFFPHTEPAWVAKSERATKLATQMADKMMEFMIEMKCRGWMVVAESDKIAKMCEKRGMKLVKHPVYLAS
jgi:hypothetical protein